MLVTTYRSPVPVTCSSLKFDALMDALGLITRVDGLFDDLMA